MQNGDLNTKYDHFAMKKENFKLEENCIGHFFVHEQR